MESGRPSLRDILRVLFRHWPKIVLFFIAVVTFSTISTLLQPETFQSNARLLIRVGRESVSVDPSVVGPIIGLAQDRENEINSEIGILTSTLLAERLVRELGFDFITGNSAPKEDAVPVPPQIAVATVLGSLDVAPERNSNVISVSFRSGSPKSAQASLDTLIELYLDRHIEVHSTQASPAFFESQSGLLLNELMRAEDELEQFRIDNGIVSIEAQKQELLAQITTLDIKFDELRGQIESTNARISALQNSLNARSERSVLSRVSGIVNPTVDDLKQRLIDLRFEEVDLVARYPDDERALLDVRQQIELALNELSREEETRTQVTMGLDRNFEALQLDLMRERSALYANMARRDSLSAELGEKRRQLSELGQREINLTRLERAVRIAEQEYEQYVRHHQLADASAALDSNRVSNVSIVQPASLPLYPIWPRKRLVFLLSLFVGSFGGIALGFLFEYLDDSVKTGKDVGRRLGVPLLATFSAEER